MRRALGMSHRAASLALAQCEEWGLIERANVQRRSGQRGPAATAWNVVDDHWEWFRRVARARKERETDPVLPVIERCVAEAHGIGDREADPEPRRARRSVPASPRVRPALRPRRGDLRPRRRARHRGRVRGARLGDDDGRDRPGACSRELGPDETLRAVEHLATLSPAAARRLISLADQPVLRKLVGLA